MASAREYIESNAERFRAELFDFLRIPSVSARTEHRADTRRAADWLKGRLEEIGLRTSLHETSGHPILLGEWRNAGSDAPTVLVYGHYDVQPPEPLELWTTPPFEPDVRNGRIYARGAVDDKGQLYVHVKAAEALLKANGSLPVNLILLFEGEEDVGSETLMPFVEQNADRLKCDAIVISDTTMIGPGVPTIGASLRGMVYFEINVQGPARDLHSGSYGGAVINPATALARIIASMHDDDWRVTIDGFYDDVRAAEDFRAAIRALPFDSGSFLHETGSPSLDGEVGQSTLERLWVRPTCEVNGLLSGYTGEGSKTVLPSRAMAKVSCRLVPDQDPKKIVELVRRHVEKHTPAGVTADVAYLHGGKPWRARLEGRLVEAAATALASAWGRDVVYAGEGGSIPIVPEFERVLHAPALLMGLGLPGENAHAPDEWMSIENFEKGIVAAAELLTLLGTT